jgi:acyl carrier protein
MTKEEILVIILAELGQMDVDKRITLSFENADKITFENLRIDSLESLQFALNLENRFGIDLEITAFPKDASLAELADYLLIVIKNKASKNTS